VSATICRLEEVGPRRTSPKAAPCSIAQAVSQPAPKTLSALCTPDLAQASCMYELLTARYCPVVSCALCSASRLMSRVVFSCSGAGVGRAPNSRSGVHEVQLQCLRARAEKRLVLGWKLTICYWLRCSGARFRIVGCPDTSKQLRKILNLAGKPDTQVPI
jgi:hypothetical protein